MADDPNKKENAKEQQTGREADQNEQIKASLTQNILALTQKARAKSDADDKNGFHNWSDLLNRRYESPEVFSDLNLFHRGFLALESAVDNDESMSESLQQKYRGSFSRLHRAVSFPHLHKKMGPNQKRKSSAIGYRPTGGL